MSLTIRIIIPLIAVAAAGILYLVLGLSPASPEARIVAACAEEDSKENCYAQELENIALVEGSVAGFTLLQRIQSLDPSARGCHFIAHAISYGSFERSPLTWKEDLQTVYPGCSYGGIHGLLEKAFDRYGLTLDPAYIADICGENPRADCNHSLGHLLLVEHEGDIDVSLGTCNALNDALQRRMCLGGVFMESITATNLVNHGIVDKVNATNWVERLPSLTETCKRHDGDEADMCWTELAHAIVARFGPDYQSSYEYCVLAQSESAVFECAQHAVGITLAVFDFDLSKTDRMCVEVDEGFRESCYLQLVGSFLSTIPDGTEDALAYCAVIPDAYRWSCLERVEHMRLQGDRYTPLTEGL